MPDCKTTMTILGMSGAGKTCYLLGMYYELSAGMRGYTITTNDDDDVHLKDLYNNLNDEKGPNRFPAGTDSSVSYQFQLRCNYKTLMDFNWVDYPGGYLDRKTQGNLDDYRRVERSILESSCLFVCIDGNLLCGKNTEKKIRDIRHKCGSIMNSFFASYMDKHGELPPTAFIITKYDKCCNDTDEEEISEIIEEAFNAFFHKPDKGHSIVAIIPVSIGMNIDEEEEDVLDPLNIQLPIFMGIYFALGDRIAVAVEDKERIKKEKKEKIEKEIEKLQEIINQENDMWWFLRDNDRRDRAAAKKNQLTTQNLSSTEISQLTDFIANKSKYWDKLKKEVQKINLVFVDGEKREDLTKI